MKYMRNLSPIPLMDMFDRQLVDNDEKKITMTFKNFITRRLVDSRLKDMDAKLSILQIKQAIKDEDAVQYALESADWELLSMVVKAPEGAAEYDAQFEHNCVPFMKEILNAQESPFEDEEKSDKSDNSDN